MQGLAVSCFFLSITGSVPITFSSFLPCLFCSPFLLLFADVLSLRRDFCDTTVSLLWLHRQPTMSPPSAYYNTTVSLLCLHRQPTMTPPPPVILSPPLTEWTFSTHVAPHVTLVTSICSSLIPWGPPKPPLMFPLPPFRLRISPPQSRMLGSSDQFASPE